MAASSRAEEDGEKQTGSVTGELGVEVMNALDMVEKQQLRTDIPKFRPGDTIKVHVKIREGDKERIKVFEGICMAKKLVALAKRSRSARCPLDTAWNASSRFIRRSSTRLRSSVPGVSVGRSYITCVNSAARPPASKKSRPHNRERGAHT